MQILNIDSIATAEQQRKLKIGGVDYLVPPMTVANFIATTAIAESMDDKTSVCEQMSATIDMVMRSVPAISREVLENLSLQQLQAVVSFIRGESVDEPPATVAASEDGQGN